jgi:hypothetical protein
VYVDFLENAYLDVDTFNRKLTGWLIEYDFHRPHVALAYRRPIEVVCGDQKALPMYSPHTSSGNPPERNLFSPPFFNMPPRKHSLAELPKPREDRTEGLTDAVESLAQEVNVLRTAIDDIREELAYAVKILKTNLWAPVAQPAAPPIEDPAVASPIANSPAKTERKEFPEEQDNKARPDHGSLF